ncbi:hypothetical protein [Sphingopyxis sp.]|jgi:mannitol-specific phosphotransferase system IIBC component|uniref:hypothetical protein n=1 Tax=Sphingopyxis sp. TaxID=1908224 RepID=UPI003F710D75
MRNSVAVLIAVVALVPAAHATEMNQEKMDKVMAEANKERDRQAKERQNEQLRDKSHDYRLMVGRDTSVGFTRNGVSVLRTTP